VYYDELIIMDKSQWCISYAMDVNLDLA